MYKAIIFDFYGTLFFTTAELAPGAEELLAYCTEKELKLAAVTAGQYDRGELDRLGLSQSIPLIRIVKMYENKSPELFREVIDQLGVEPQKVIGVGDLLEREIKSLKALGATTISVHTDKPADNEQSEPDFRAKDLYEVKRILEEVLA